VQHDGLEHDHRQHQPRVPVPLPRLLALVCRVRDQVPAHMHKEIIELQEPAHMHKEIIELQEPAHMHKEIIELLLSNKLTK